MSFRGYCLTISGFVGIAATNLAGVVPTSADPLWTGGTVVEGMLEWPEGAITVRADPLSGDLSVSSLELVLNDLPGPGGPSALSGVCSWYFSRDASQVGQARLTASLSDSATSIPVASTAPFIAAGFPAQVQIERECIAVSGTSGSNLTVSSRGAFGTVAEAHDINAVDNRSPVVFAEFWNPTRRLAILWKVASSGAATPVYIGMVGEDSDQDQDTGQFRLSIEHVWRAAKKSPVGQSTRQLQLRGYSGVAGLGYIQWTIGTFSVTGYPSSADGWESLEEVFERDSATAGLGYLPDLALRIDAASSSSAFTADKLVYQARFDGDRGTVTFGWEGNDPLSGGGKLVFAGAEYQALVARTVDATNDRYQLLWKLDRLPRVALGLAGGGTDLPTLVLYADGFDLPTTWAGTPTVLDGGRQVTVNRVLRVPYDSDQWVVFGNITEGDPTRSFWATHRFVPRRVGARTPPAHAWLLDPPPAQVVTVVAADHWLEGLRYGVVPELMDVPSGVFDWTGMSDLVAATAGEGTRREWHLDGVGDFAALATEAMLLNGCTPTIRNGKVGFCQWRIPTANEVPAATFAREDILGRPGWGGRLSNFANTAELSADGLNLRIVDGTSLNVWGAGKNLAISLAGQDLRAVQPYELLTRLMGRLQLWATPRRVVKIRTTEETTVAVGDIVQVSVWGVPDGEGGRGLVDKLATVQSHKLDFAGHVELECLVWGELAYGYAPSARVNGRTGTTRVLLSKTPVQSATDYAGGTADGGVSKFAVGDRIEILRRNNTTALTESHIITALGADNGSGSPYIDLQSAMGGTLTAAIDATEWISVRYDAWGTSGLQAAQKLYMYVGDEADGLINNDVAARPITP